MKYVVVTITQDHINRGIRRLCNSCAIAVAVADKFDTEQVEVQLNTQRITLNPMTGPTLLELTPRACEWAMLFDDNKKNVQPTRFRFKVLESR